MCCLNSPWHNVWSLSGSIMSKPNHVVPICLMVAGSALLVSLLFSRSTQPASSEHAASERTRATVKHVPLARIQSISESIDRLVDARLEKENARRNAPVSDEVFVRRIYLDIAGRIPTIDEARRFLKSRHAEKRSRLIDELLDSYGYVSNQFNFWADLLRVKTRLRNTSGQPYIDYIKDSLESNKPYDQFVHELLAAEGPLYEKGNGAVGYYLRDIGMPEDNMSNTIRIFLGTRLECAQCHDHPYDKWTQRQYFEMVAFTGGVRFRLNQADSEFADEFAQLRRSREVPEALRRTVRRLIQPMTTGVSGTGTGVTRLPEDFLGDDGEAFEIVTAKEMFQGQELMDVEVPSERARNRRRNNRRNGQAVAGAREIDSRTVLAEWLTDPENPRFATVIANRLWKQAMGIGLIEPVDIIEDATVASNPQLMEFLAESMVELGFDMKQFLRAVYNSRTYQSEASGTDIAHPIDYLMQGPVVRRMSAEQIWDSLLAMSVDDIDRRGDSAQGSNLRYFGDADVYDSYAKLREMSPDELIEYADTFENGSRLERREAVMNMMKMNDLDSDSLDRRRAGQQLAQLNRQLAEARRAKDRRRIQQLNRERQRLGSQLRKQRNRRDLQRASELPSPSPAGHFLREFGQSDRDAIDNGNTEPAVTQVLSLMNGMIESRIAQNPDNALIKDVADDRNSRQRVETVFLTILSRQPTAEEISIWGVDFDDNPRDAASDLIWVLINSNEFMFRK